MIKQPLAWAVWSIVIIGFLAYWNFNRIQTTNLYSDIAFYEQIATDVRFIRSGGSPGEPSSWYPPFAAAVFYIFSLIPHSSFVSAWLIALILIIIAATAYLYWVLDWKKAYLLPIAILVCGILIGLYAIFSRYDILVGILLVLAWRSHKAQHYRSSLMWAVLAAGMKAVPIIFLPVILLATPRKDWRKAVQGIGIGILITCLVPILLLGSQNFLNTTKAFVAFHSSRGFQVESVASGFDMLVKNMLQSQALLRYHHFATHNIDLGSSFLQIFALLFFIGLAGMYWHAWKKREHVRKNLASYLIVVWLWMLFVAPVFSPQFLLWIMPIVFISLVNKIGFRESRFIKLWPAIFFLLVIVFASQWIYPWHYDDFIRQTYLFNTVVLNIRNFAVLGLLLWFLKQLGMLPRVPFVAARKRIVDFFTKETASLTEQQKKVAAWVMVIIAIGFIGYICSFKILDRDFWWHIKAGEIMTQTKGLISIEPFAYTRANQPYLATQSWLAEIFLYVIHATGGVNGIIIFRTFTMLFIFGLVLWIDKKRAWLTSLLVILAANAAQPAFIERPQLFTFMIFAWFLYLAFRVLEKGLTKKLALWLIGLEILWVNLHGAAALLGIGIVACLALQAAYNQKKLFVWKPWAYLGAGMIVAFFVSPLGYHNITYITQLLGDKTIIFINEWQPRELTVYLGETILIWIAVLWALWNTRRNWVFCTLMLVAMGVLSRQALRHEVLFIFTAVGITIYQLKYSAGFARFAEYLVKRQILAGLLLVVSLFGLFKYTTTHYQNFAQEDQLFGYGVFTPAKGAYEFLEKNKIEGQMFNTYGIGGYLLHRGYPNRKVYIDGRNVDYGYEFMNATYQGGLDGDSWKKLEDKYDLDYAIIDYMAIATVGRMGYSVHLDKNPNWPLVYLDDWTAVYLKDTSENSAIIQSKKYKLVTPINFDKGQVLDTLTSENKAAMISELERVKQENPDGVKARLLLARIYISDGNFEMARPLLDEVKHIQPHLADTYQLLATIALSEQQWIEASRQYSLMLARTGKAYSDINYRAIADVFSKAGYWWSAAYYNWLAKPDIQLSLENTQGVSVPNSATVQSGSGPISQEGIADLFASIAKDLQTYNDKGVDFAQSGKLPEAKNEFMEALKLDPGNPQTLNNLGALSLQMEDEKAAMDYLKRALERTDEYPDAHYNLAILYYYQQNYLEALKEAQLAQKYGRDSKSLIDTIKNKLK